MRKDLVEDTEGSFFGGKRPWSLIKDTVLGSYMKPYLTKVRKLNRPMLVIDCFAGPGKFADGSDGSPLIICQMVARYAKGKCRAVFVNKIRGHHEKLTETLRKFIGDNVASTILGDSQDLLRGVGGAIRDQTLFVYLDPFGLKGCQFDSIKSVLERGNKYSTEILVNLSMPTFHRLAARHAVAKGQGDSPIIRKFHRILDDVFGGSYWRDYAFGDALSPEEREWGVTKEYLRRLQSFLPFTGCCPVQERPGSRIKYFITFCSRHVDALLLMNDFMCKAYYQHLHEASLRDMPLFAKVEGDWRSQRHSVESALKAIVLQEVRQEPGRSRKEVWASVVSKQFMRFVSKEFRDVVNQLSGEGSINSPTPRSTARLNDNCRLHPC